MYMAVILATIIVLATFFIVAGALTNKRKKGEKVSTFKILGTLGYGGCLLVVLVIIVSGLIVGLVSGVLNVL